MDQDTAAFARISRELLTQPGEATTVQRIAELAAEVVPSASHVGVTLRMSQGQLETAASTDPIVLRADQLQYDLNEGPCVDSARAAETYIAEDTTTDGRWPRWGPKVAEFGLRSVLSVQLPGGPAGPLGALNLYATVPHTYTEADVDYAHVFAHHAAGALATSRERDGLRTALNSRHVIGIAQGMLMQRFGLTQQQALDVLFRHSQDTNVKVRDVASAMVQAGRIAPASPQPTRTTSSSGS